MVRVLLLLLLSTLPSAHVLSQIFPKEKSELHYRIIGFKFPEINDADRYTIEIASGDYDDETKFENHIIKTIAQASNRVIAEVPYWGTSYTWRITYHNKTAINKKSNFHHFATMSVDLVDSCKYRLTILTKASKYTNAYVFLDSHCALYDMNGQPVWFLPHTDGKNIIPRDLKMTPFGTITYMKGTSIYEINYNGDILWTGPDALNPADDNNGIYHHQFSRLNNGNYMVLGNELCWQKKQTPDDSSFTIIPKNAIHADSNDKNYIKLFLGTVLEYDRQGKVVWTWRSSDYFNKSDLSYHRSSDNRVVPNTHENAFYFDEANKVVYVSFKGISRILKIKYPEGNVLNVYGELYKRDMPIDVNRFFCEQHSCMKSQKGYLYLYDNNLCNRGKLPKVVMMKEPENDRDSLRMVWEYECPIERDWQNLNTVYLFPSGGNVIELPDQSMFVNMGGSYSKVFIVTPDKNVVWSALPEKWNEAKQNWEIFTQYRASIITDHKNLEHLIWGGEQ